MNCKLKVVTSALAVGLLCGPAFAQTAPSGPASTPAPPAQQATPATPPKPIEGQITMQSDDTVLASTLIGATVSGQNDENTASIKDLILKTDGSIDGVVIGVGGFLGIGEHPVAVKWDKIQLKEGQSGRMTIHLTATKEDLKAATPFKSKTQVEADRQAETLRQQRPATPTAPPTPR